MGKLSALGMVTAVLLFGGCAHQGKRLPVVKDEPFKIGREDVLDVAVWRDGDLSRVLPVRPDGFISMPIVGEVKAEGKTPTQLAEEIKTRLQPYVQEPKVTVIVREVNSSRVFVTGEVARPGSYPLRGKVSLLQAVALAGGFSDFANKEGILVIRQGQDGGQYPVRYSELVSDDQEARTDALLMPGDTVVVP
jgi:polysaccharide biosynthesis/export protein